LTAQKIYLLDIAYSDVIHLSSKSINIFFVSRTT